MEKSKRELESLVVSQKEQLERYEKRLKDVVTAYKGLVKEKEALETSLNALTASRDTEVSEGAEGQVKPDEPLKTPTADNKEYLQKQVITLMNSLATLSAEKSRMEASFQTDKKQLRLQLTQKDEQILDLQNQQKSLEEHAKQRVEEMRAKWINERQEREKETNNQMIMIRELQKLYADERQVKENMEMQLNNLKAKLSNREAESSHLHDLQQQLEETNLKMQQLNVTDAELATRESNDRLLEQLKNELQQLKEQHAITLKNEQRRLVLSEEQSRKQAALHEERVANLEARLQDLSNSVGKYDRLRQQDQLNIQALKQQLHDLEYESQKTGIFADQKKYEELSVNDIVEKVLDLKRLLLLKCEHGSHSLDINKIFTVQTHNQDVMNLQQQYETAKLEIISAEEQLKTKSAYINTLLEKVKSLNRIIEEQELELKSQAELRQESLKEERNKWQQIVNEKEHQYRYKLNELEQQLQKQRQRSLQLLNEKDDEIKALQSSFDILKNSQHNLTNEVGRARESESDKESMPDPTEHKTLNLTLNENIPLLHYANELARKDKEISSLRKAKFMADNALRSSIQEKVMVQQELHNRIAQLEEQADRFERCMSREGANLEYLKNVILSFLTTRDLEGKRHMLNAISAVLHLTPTEIQAINEVFPKKVT